MRKIVVIFVVLLLVLMGCNDNREEKPTIDDISSAISDIRSDSDGNLVFELTDGRKFTVNTIKAKDGADGKDGKDGTNGRDGKDGLNGVDGKDGIDGKDGKDGLNGVDGKDGIDGKDGKDGLNGVDGKDGIDGKDGKDGLNGVDGKDGVSIVKVTINNDNHLVCTLSDDTVIDAGDLNNGNLADDIISSLYVEDGYEVSIGQEYPCSIEPFIVLDASCKAYKLDIPVCNRSGYYEYELKIEVRIKNETSYPVLGINSGMLNPFGASLSTANSQITDAVENDDGSTTYMVSCLVPYVLKGSKSWISSFVWH